MVRQLILILSFSLLQACGNPLKGTSASSSGIQAFGVSDSELTTYWDSSQFPLTIQIDPYFEEDEYNGITEIGDVWNQAAGKSLLKFQRASDSLQYVDLNSYRDSSLGIHFMEQWFDDLSPHALAVTQFYGQKIVKDGTEMIKIIHADILINGEYYDFSITSASGRYDLLSVVLHELGHFLGLKHDYSESSVMLPVLSIEQQKRVLATNDKADLLKLYPQATTQSLAIKSVSASQISDSKSPELVVGVYEISPTGESYKQRKIIPSP